MEIKKRRLDKVNIPEEDLGISVAELMQLLNTDIKEELLKELEIEDIKDDFIPIKGAKTLFNSQLAIQNKFVKLDLLSGLHDISVYDGKEFSVNFKNIANLSDLPNVSSKSIVAYPIYSAQRDFFSNLFNMEKYAKTLIENGNKNIIEKNFELLRQECDIRKKYRILYNKSDKKYYLRAIISKDRYYDYNNSVVVVLGLLTLYREMKNSNSNYSLMRCEYNESYIRMFFDTSKTKNIDESVFVKNIVEISNDELKRESFKFHARCTINYSREENSGEIFISSKDIKSKVFSINHSQSPKNAIPVLAQINNLGGIHRQFYDDVLTINKIQNTEQIKFLVRRKIENARNEDVKKYQSEILNELIKTTTKNIVDLLELFNKIQILTSQDIEAGEYLRYVFYEALIDRK
ncbi:hypothetical protein [Capnocytophaga canis]|uniref:Uncharacterized protein n=1 Tax=Capnocytophaga canis TaxID=1848903 RepID=A0A0B7I744_9FLAO|nr:hypothetical protein [Capnocytophaga canis]CEN47560.1 hypothetical protein CCAND38_450018 [Capnocytophaga canis]